MKKKYKIRRFFVNLLCGLVANKHARRKIRVVLDTRFLSICRFVKRDSGVSHPKLKIIIGTRGRNLVISVNDKYVYKFRAVIDDFDDSLEKREYEIASELSKVSPVPIIVPTIIKYSHGIARRYDFVSGINFKQLVNNKKYDVARDSLVHQLAEFIYKVSSADPVKIRKYKQEPQQKPGYMLGWHHVDLFENFLIDENTFRINGIIDWEEIEFSMFSFERKYNGFLVFEQLMDDIKKQYNKLYNKKS